MKITRDWRRHPDQAFFMGRYAGFISGTKRIGPRDFDRVKNAIDYIQADPFIKGATVHSRRVYTSRKPLKYSTDFSNHKSDNSLTDFWNMLIEGRGYVVTHSDWEKR